MKKSDLIFLIVALIVLLPFFISDRVYSYYLLATNTHPYAMAFLKFAILATAGESIGLRIKNNIYNYPGFGLAPRAIVWGILGVGIAIAMKVFSAGAPRMVEGFGIPGVTEAMSGPFSGKKLLGAFSISVLMNSFFAPVFMTFHKITDTHILENGGSLRALITPIPMRRIFGELNWQTQWSFVFKKTIPLFWIPAHTITFLLPATFQVLFAALLGVILGVLLSIAAVLSRESHKA